MTSSYFAEKTEPITRELPYTPQDTSTQELALVPVYLSAFLLVLIPTTNLSASEFTRSTFLFACSNTYVQELSLTYVINLSLSIRSFPSVYKYALTFPILKKRGEKPFSWPYFPSQLPLHVSAHFAAKLLLRVVCTCSLLFLSINFLKFHLPIPPPMWLSFLLLQYVLIDLILQCYYLANCFKGNYKKKQDLLYLPTYLLFPVLFISSYRFGFPLRIIFPQPEGYPLTFLNIADLTGNKFSQLLLIWKWIYFTLNIWRIFLWI